MNVAARMAAPMERERRRRNTINSALAAGAVVAGGLVAYVMNTADPFNSTPDQTINGIYAPAVIDAAGNDVAADCMDFAEAHSGQEVATLSQQRLLEYAAACSLPVGGSEQDVQKIAARMLAFAAGESPEPTLVTRGVATPQP